MRESDRIITANERARTQESWDKVTAALKENPESAYDAIDVTLPADVVKTQMSYIESMRKYGEIKSGHQTYLELKQKLEYSERI